MKTRQTRPVIYSPAIREALACLLLPAKPRFKSSAEKLRAKKRKAAGDS